MSRPKIVVVVPTVRPDCHARFVEAWRPMFERHRVTLVTVWDGESPSVTMRYYGSPTEQEIRTENAFDYFGPQYRDLFCRRTDGCRNIGFCFGCRSLDPDDVVLTLDDDCYPPIGMEGASQSSTIDPIQAHIDALSRRVPISWMNTAHDTDLYLRGVPYEVRDEAPVMLSHGVWVGTPDFDGETQLRLEGKDCWHCGGTGKATRLNEKCQGIKIPCPECGSTGRGGVPHSLPYFVGPIPRGVLFPLCFVPKAEVTMADGSRRKIRDVRVGDRVFAKGGESHPVLRVMKNDHSGEVIYVRAAGRDRDVVCTPNHPLWVLRKGQSEPEWVEAQNLSLDDMVSVPRVTGGSPVNEPTSSTCRLIGYFLADGHYDKYSPDAPHAMAGKYTGLQFTFGTEKKARAIEDCKRCLSNLGFTYRQEQPKPTATTIVTNVHYELVTQFYETYRIGEYSSGKRLPAGIYSWSTGAKRDVLSAYWAGDGCFTTIQRTKGNEQHQGQAKTRSRTLAVQIQLLMQSLGFPSSVARLSPYKQSKECWSISINGTRAREFAAFLDGGPCPESGKRPFDKAFCDDRYVYYKVKSITRKKYNGPVYNLTVEDDHSYLVEGVTVKNCGMNVMIKRDALPYLYYAPMGKDCGHPNLHRFADIFMGLWLKNEFDHRDWACVTGYSTIHHTRASDARRNYEQEKLGREWMEWMWKDAVDSYDVGHEELRPDLPDTYQYYCKSYADKRARYAELVTTLLKDR